MNNTYFEYTPYYEEPVRGYVICWNCGAVNLEPLDEPIKCHLCKKLILKVK